MDYRDLLKVVKKTKDVDAWEITRSRRKARELYVTMGSVESERMVDTESLELAVYTERWEQDRKVLGESRVVINPQDDYRERIDLAVEMAQRVSNDPFPLPGPGPKYPDVPLYDRDVAVHPEQAIGRVRTEIEQAADHGVEVSSMEIVAGERETLLLNSNGLELKTEKTRLFVDFVLLSGGDPERETEMHGFRSARFLRDLNMSDMVREYAGWTLDSLSAKEPPTGSFDVVLSHEAVESFFSWFKPQAGGAAKHQGWSSFTEGVPVAEGMRGDRITLSSDPGLPGGMASGSFDAHGLPLHRRPVVEGNVFRTRMADSRYGAYLKAEPTGDFTNMVVEPGSTPFQDLFRPSPVLHVVKFSVFAPNAVTGAFSGEIRFGYLVGENGVTPVKGGSVSGMMSEALKDLRLSRETVKRESYLGPAGIRVNGLAVAGGDEHA